MAIAAALDDLGRPAWLALMILSFIFCWPIGLALLAFLIGSGRMGCWRHGERHLARWERRMERGRDRMERAMARWGGHHQAPSSGNRAFDDYRAETLRRLEEEEREFREFLDRLRFARDKAEFDQFLSERRRPQGPEPQPQG